ncbi:hypothetical protein Neosp_015237 [[Neocosmospora] mangrovei]
MPLNLPAITLEEHIFTKYMWERFDERARKGMAARNPRVHERLLDTGESRIADMDKYSIQTQVLSHIPMHTSREDMKRVNDELKTIKDQHPGRYHCFTFLSMNKPDEAAEELERCVKDHGSVGALFPNVLDDGTFYDTPRFYPLYAKAEELDVPLYFHPIYPTPDQTKLLFEGPYSKVTEIQLSAWCFGWHVTVAIHILRLFAAGIFDKFPKVKIVIGHMGETLPFMLDRIIPRTAEWPEASVGKRELRQVWDENIWVTTSGMFTMGPMECLLKTTKIDRILFSVDYPLEGNDEGYDFLKKLKQSRVVDDESFEKIVYKNAKALLRI